MKSLVKRSSAAALAGLLLCLAFVPAVHAVEILRWERLPLAVPLVVGQERVVFIERNVRIGVPPTVGEQLRVQSAGGAIYLRANAPILPTRLQLQDVESGALILLDIAAEPAKAGQPALEPVRIVEGDVPATRYGEPAKPAATADDDAERTAPAAKQATPVAVAHALCGAEPLRAAAHRRAVPASAASTAPAWSFPPAADAAGACAGAGRVAARDQWVTAVKLTNPPAGSTWTPRVAGRLPRRDLPAPEPSAGRPRRRHHGRLPRYPWPRPGRVAAAQALTDRRTVNLRRPRRPANRRVPAMKSNPS